MSVPSVHEKMLMSAQMRALAVAKGKPYTDLPPQSMLAAIVKHGGLHTLLDADLMTGRIAAFAEKRPGTGIRAAASAPNMPTPDIVQKLRSTAASFFYKLVDQKGYTVHSELMAYLTEPGQGNGVIFDPGVDPSPHIPAAFTFVGQFIDHDLTFNGMNLTVNEQNIVVVDDASPIIDLDNVYGPRSLAKKFTTIYDEKGQFRLKEKRRKDGKTVYYDVPRYPDVETGPAAAYIFDPRNDENQLILQVHILVERLHNKVRNDPRFRSELQKLKDPTDPGQIVDRVRKEVVAIWQSFVLNEYMPAVILPEVLDEVKKEIHKKAPDVDHLAQLYGNLEHKPYRDLVTGKNVVRMPHEFAIGFRFGHSQLRPAYKLNASPPVLLFRDARRSDTVEINGQIISGRDDLRGGRVLEPEHAIDWNIFYPKTLTDETKSLRIDRKVTARVFNLPESAIPDDIKYVANLPHRNLIRGSQLGVVSGEELADFYGITRLTPEQVLGNDAKSMAVRELFMLDLKDDGTADFKTPLWYYILKEAEVQSKGARLGKLGSRLVGEVLAGACYYGEEFAFKDSWKSKVINTSSSSNAIKLHDIIDYIESPYPKEK